MARQAKENLPGGSLKYQFVYSQSVYSNVATVFIYIYVVYIYVHTYVYK
jgi:hypothetical protein